MNYPKVSIIILNWNGLKDTIECLESLKKITYPNYEVIVVDNGSEGNDADVLEEKYGNYIKLIRNKENLGFTGGNNVAIHYALEEKNPPDYIFLLNNDAIIKGDCLEHLVSVAQKINAGIVGAVIRKKNTNQIHSIGGMGSYPLIRQFFNPLVRWPNELPTEGKDCYWTCFWVSGAGMLIRKKVLREIYSLRGTYLNGSLFLYWDEFEFCSIARKLGYDTVITKKAVVYHREHATSTGGRYNPIAYYYDTRNGVVLAGKFLPLPLRILFHPYHFLLRSAQILKNIIYRRFYSAWAIFCGLWDGYRGTIGKWKYHDQAMLKWKKQK